jgi:uncharacterized protein with PQ loop repeat
MELVDVLGISASACGVVMALAPLLQARRVLARRSGADVSQPFLAIIAAGACMWAAYGIADANAYLIVPNVIAVGTNAVTLALARRFTSRRRGLRARDGGGLQPERG